LVGSSDLLLIVVRELPQANRAADDHVRSNAVKKGATAVG
jgi:hypothetical protein